MAVESSVILRIPLSIYHFKIVFGFGDSLCSAQFEKLWEFYLAEFQGYEGKFELLGLFLVLPTGASISEDLIVRPSEKIGMITNPYTILSLGPKDM